MLNIVSLKTYFKLINYGALPLLNENRIDPYWICSCVWSMQ
jgi:hypothetical protein